MATTTHQYRETAPRLWFAVTVVSALVLSVLAAPTQQAAAQQAPAGVAVVQGQGFATVSWDEVEGASEYQIERTPMDGDEPSGPGQIVGRWFPDRYLGLPPAGDPTGHLTFADAGFTLGERYQWRVRALLSQFPNQVTIDAPSPAAGTYEAHGASFGPALDEAGPAGQVVLADDGSANPTLGCDPLVGFPAGAIALVDRGTCTFVQKVRNAQSAGAVGVIVVNNTAGAPTNMTGTAADVTIPSVMVWRSDGDTMKAGLPATGQLRSAPVAVSEPVVDNTQENVGPAEFLTGFELSDGQNWTLHEDEVEVVEAIAAASDRVRLETIGESYEGRPMHLATVGYPEPLEPDQIADSPSVFIMCTIHGPERSGREGCLILLRELAFSNDQRVIDILSHATVLINPTANPDGQNVGRRTNTAGTDLNRDSLLLRHPETFPLAEVIRDHQPDVIVDAHERGGSPADTEPSWPRSRIIHEELVALSQDLMIGGLFADGYEAGWAMLPYTGWANNNWEAWHHNMAGMKNALGQLLETPTPALAPRPNAPSGSPQNMKRRVYTQLWSLHSILDYHRENLATIEAVIDASTAANTANQGPVYLDGAYPPPYDAQYSRAEPFTVELDPFCGYRLSAEQYSVQDSGTLIGPLAGQQWTSATVEDRLDAHGVEVAEIGAGIVQVPLAQPLRAMLPFVLDPELDTAVRPIGTPNLGMVDAVRLDDRRPTVIVGDVDSGVPNRVDEVNCSINDLIADEQVWPNHGRFMQHVTNVVRDLRAAGLISGQEGGAIIDAASQSDVGR